MSAYFNPIYLTEEIKALGLHLVYVHSRKHDIVHVNRWGHLCTCMCIIHCCACTWPFFANLKSYPSHMCRLHDDRAVFELNTEIQLLLKQGQVRQKRLPERGARLWALLCCLPLTSQGCELLFICVGLGRGGEERSCLPVLGQHPHPPPEHRGAKQSNQGWSKWSSLFGLFMLWHCTCMYKWAFSDVLSSFTYTHTHTHIGSGCSEAGQHEGV